MSNLKSLNSMTVEKFQMLNDLLSKLETQSVMVDLKTSKLNLLYGEDCFCGYVDDTKIYFGSIEYYTSIERSEIINVTYTQIGYSISLEISLSDNSTIKIYN